MKMRKAFTFVELLVVIGVIAVLTAIALPLLAYSKIAAHRSSDSSALRQIGQAAALYEQDEGQPTLYTQPLVTKGLVPRPLMTSPLDITVAGYANVFRALTYGKAGLTTSKQTTYRDSYLSIADSGATSAGIATVMQWKNPGWLVAFADRAPTDPLGNALDSSTNGEIVFQGVYLRLLMDGSVQTRHHQVKTTTANGVSITHDVNLLGRFGDHP